MKTLFRQLLKNESTVISSSEIYKMFPHLNRNAVQAKIKRCLNSGELQRLYKGVYTVHPDFSHKPIQEEQVALAIDNQSYLTGMGALRFHNLIPDIVNQRTYRGKKNVTVNQPFLHFEIKKNSAEYLSLGVLEISVENKKIRVANPTLAILDIFIDLKMAPSNRSQICSFLRIDEDDMNNINWQQALAYLPYATNPLTKKIVTAMLSE